MVLREAFARDDKATILRWPSSYCVKLRQAIDARIAADSGCPLLAFSDHSQSGAEMSDDPLRTSAAPALIAAGPLPKRRVEPLRCGLLGSEGVREATGIHRLVGGAAAWPADAARYMRKSEQPS